MTRAWKVAAVAAVLLLLPAAAFAVGALTAPPGEPTPRRDITISEGPAPSTPATTRSPSAPPETPGRIRGDQGGRQGGGGDNGKRGKDDVRVVTPRPAPVDDDGDDLDDRDHSGDDDSDDGDDDD